MKNKIKTLKAIWFFGLSGSGKSTLANNLQENLSSFGLKCFVLDGDIVRKGINNNLGFSRIDRRENVRRIAELCKILMQLDVVPIVAAITPYEEDRTQISKILDEQLILIHVICSLKECEKRDPKGLYKLVRQGKIEKFTGVSDNFEQPNNSIIAINTEKYNISDCLIKLLRFISDTSPNFPVINDN